MPLCSGGKLYSVPWISLPGSAFQPVAPQHVLSCSVNMPRFVPTDALSPSCFFLSILRNYCSLPYTFLDASPNRGSGVLQEVPAHSWLRYCSRSVCNCPPNGDLMTVKQVYLNPHDSGLTATEASWLLQDAYPAGPSLQSRLEDALHSRLVERVICQLPFSLVLKSIRTWLCSLVLSPRLHGETPMQLTRPGIEQVIN